MLAVKKKQLVVAISLSIPGIVVSQEVFSNERFQLEETIVIAQKRAENIQDVPIAISAFSDDDLAARGITDTESLANSVPGLNVSQSGTNSRITVRGIGSEQLTATGDPGVAFHIDGVYQSRASASSALFYDLERVEVLRGPQGTIYGRNSTGGSINLISKKPEDITRAQIDVQAGNYNHRRVRAMVNMPLVGDTLLFRLSGQNETRDGFYENLNVEAGDLEDRDAQNLRAQFLFTPSDALSALLSINYSADKGEGYGSKPLGDFSNSPKPVDVAHRFFATPNPKDPWVVSTNDVNDSEAGRQGASLTLDWDVGFAAVKTITAWQDNDIEMTRDTDESDFDIVQEFGAQKSVQYSQEIQMSSIDSGALTWITGLYWLSEKTDVDFWLFDSGTGLSMIAPSIDVGLQYRSYFGNTSAVESDSLGAYAQASYDLTDTVKLTGGLRYSEDEKQSTVFGKELFSPIGSTFGNEGSWSKATWKLGLDWAVAEDSLLYTSLSTGFKSGGFLDIENAKPYEQEEVLALELGSKNRLLDGRLQANVSAYYYEYTDMQLRTVRALTSVVTNAGEAKIQGVEIEMLALPIEGLELSVALAFTNAEFTQYIDDDPLDLIPITQPLDLSGNDLARSPDYTANINAAYTWQFSWGSLTSSVNYFLSDDIYFSAFNRKDADYQDAYHKTDVSLQLTNNDNSWYMTLAAHNLENTEVASIINVPNATFGGLNSAQWQPPRTYKLSIGYNFD